MKRSFDVRQFTKGILGTVDPDDLVEGASAFSLDVNAEEPHGILCGRKDDTPKTVTGIDEVRRGVFVPLNDGKYDFVFVDKNGSVYVLPDFYGTPASSLLSAGAFTDPISVFTRHNKEVRIGGGLGKTTKFLTKSGATWGISDAKLVASGVVSLATAADFIRSDNLELYGFTTSLDVYQTNPKEKFWIGYSCLFDGYQETNLVEFPAFSTEVIVWDWPVTCANIWNDYLGMVQSKAQFPEWNPGTGQMMYRYYGVVAGKAVSVYGNGPDPGAGGFVQISDPYNLQIYASGAKFNLTKGSIPSRLSHLNIYMAYSTDRSASVPDGDYRLAWQFTRAQVDAWGATSGFLEVSSERVLGHTYLASSGRPSGSVDPTPDYGLAVDLDGYLFIAQADMPSDGYDVENMIFRSLPLQYDAFNWSQDYAILPFRPIAMASYMGRIFCFGSTGMVRVNPVTLGIEATYEGVSCLGRDSVLTTEWGLFWAGNDDIWQMEQNAVRSIGMPILAFTHNQDGAATYYGYRNRDSNGRVLLGFHTPTKSLVLVTHKTIVATQYPIVYDFDVESGRWDMRQLAAGSISGVFSGKDGELYYSHDDGASADQIYSYQSNAARKGWTWVSPWYDFDDQVARRKIYRLILRVDGNLTNFFVYYRTKAETSGTPTSWTTGSKVTIEDGVIGVQLDTTPTGPDDPWNTRRHIQVKLVGGDGLPLVHGFSIIYRDLQATIST